MRPRRFKGYIRVLAVDPGSHGFGYAVLEGPSRLIDWGTTDIRKDKDSSAARKVDELLRWYEPDVLVVEDCSHDSSRRNPRITALVARMLEIAAALGVSSRRIPIFQMYRHFAKGGARNKYMIAVALVDRFPSLLLRLPPKRKPWQSEDRRMSIFDAVALGITYLIQHRRQPADTMPLAHVSSRAA